MASVTVKVDINERSLLYAVNHAEGTRAAINELSQKITGRANSMATEKTGLWHETGKPHTAGNSGGGEFHDHGKTYETIGGKDANYAYKPAKMGREGLVGIVFAANYAAQKDNYKHNTLLKAKG